MEKSSIGPDGNVTAGRDGPKILCIVGIPRTGTNHLCSILRQIPQVESRFEIFHPVRSYTMQPDELMELSRLVGRSFEPSSENREAVGVIREHPSLALDCILRFMQAPKRVLSFKVFSHHLPLEVVRSEIIARPDTMVVFVRRRPIDTYISHQKAIGLGKWSMVDTTDFKVPIDAADFVNWWQQAVDWYHYLEAACLEHGKTRHHLSYEKDISTDGTHLARRLCAIMASDGVAGLSIPGGDQLTGIPRQDRTEGIEQRVSNWSEFYEQLSALGAKDKAFAPMPHFTPL